MISLLISARRNSKFLSKLLNSIEAKTNNPSQVEVLVMNHLTDTWNSDLIDNWYKKEFNFSRDRENYGLGRYGLHMYFNHLAKRATGDWLMYLCDDHDIIMQGWDAYILNHVALRNLYHKDPYVLVPRFDNTGSVNHILSRGMYEALGEMGSHSHIDSYLNDLFDKSDLPDNVIHQLSEKPMLTDYTVDSSIMTDSHTYVPYKDGFQPMVHRSDEYNKLIQIKSLELKNALQK